jgi:hypothetical protein
MSYLIRGAVAASVLAAVTGAGVQAASAAPLPRCHTADLHITLHELSASAGHRHADINFVNASHHTCRMFGFPGLGLHTASGGLSTITVRQGVAHQLVLHPGQHAYSRLQWGVVPVGNENSTGCGPTPTSLRVIPPNETTSRTTSWPGPICGHRTIDTGPVTFGTAPVS